MKRLSAFILSVFLFCSSFSVHARSNSQLDEGAEVMQFLHFQWENSFQYDFSGGHTLTMPTTILRFGMASFAEIRFQYEGSLVKSDSTKWEYDCSPFVIGAKFNVYDGYKGIPRIAFLANLAIPITHVFEEVYIAPSMFWLFDHRFSWFECGYSVGLEWNGRDKIPSIFLSGMVKFNVLKNLAVFAESYNYFDRITKTQTKVNCFCDFGFNYMVHPRVELDLYASFDCRQPKSYFDVGFGVVWNIN